MTPDTVDSVHCKAEVIIKAHASTIGVYLSVVCSELGCTTSTSFQAEPGSAAKCVVDYLFARGQPSDTLSKASIKKALTGISTTIWTRRILSKKFNKVLTCNSNIS